MIKVGSEVLYKVNACIFFVTKVNNDGSFNIESEFEVYSDVMESDIELIG